MPEFKRSVKFLRILLRIQLRSRKLSHGSKRSAKINKVNLSTNLTLNCRDSVTKLIRSRQTLLVSSRKISATSSKKWTTGTNIRTVLSKTSLVSLQRSSLLSKQLEVKISRQRQNLSDSAQSDNDVEVLGFAEKQNFIKSCTVKIL